MRFHIENNFKKEELLRFCIGYTKFKASGTLPQEYKHITNCFALPKNQNKESFLAHKDKVETHLRSLTESQRGQIRVIYGHLVPYGIHKIFARPARYVTFFRDPVNLAVSYYNFLLTVYHSNPKTLKTGKERVSRVISLEEYFKRNFTKTLLANGKIIPFKEYFEKYYNYIPTALRFLTGMGYIDKESNKIDEQTLKETLDKFYFTGITENYNEDALFLYHALGIRKFYGSQNIATIYFTPREHESVPAMEFEQELYECAREANKKFKSNSKLFYTKVQYIKIKRMLFFLFTGKFELTALFLRQSYRMSAWLKQRSAVYSRFINYIKGVS